MPCERARVVAVSVSPMAVLEVRIGEQPVDAQTNSSRPTMELKMPSMAVSETLNVVRRMPAKETQRRQGLVQGHAAGRLGQHRSGEGDPPATTVQTLLRPNEIMW